MSSFVSSLKPEVYEAYLASECDRLTEEISKAQPDFSELLEKQILGLPGQEGLPGVAAARLPLDKERVKPVFGPSIGFPLEETLERRWIALISCHLLYVRKGEMLADMMKTVKAIKSGVEEGHNPGEAIFKELRTFPGIEILDGKETNYRQNCVWYVFQEEAWYQELEKASGEDLDSLDQFLFSKNTLSNLEKVGYKKVYVPKQGAIIVYLNYSTPAHFGKVVEVRKDGQVMVESRFNSFYTCRHKRDSVPASYGSECVYMKKIEKGSTPAADQSAAK